MTGPARSDPLTSAGAAPRRASEVRLAVVGPTFFSYVQAIAAEFEQNGIAVSLFDEKHSNRVSAKIAYRLGLGHNRLSPLPRYLRDMADDIRRAGCTDVFLVGVEVISRDFVARLTADGIRVHLFMWDSEANKPRFLTYLDLLSSAATFDPNDARRHGMTYVALFAEAIFDEARLGRDRPYAYDIGFCGTVHSARARVLGRLVEAPWARPLRLALMLYYHSRGLFLVKATMVWSAWRLARRISSRSFPKEAVARMFGETRFILDIPHPGQTGMTARTFEALLAGCRLITFNRGAAELLPDTLQDRVQIVDRIDEVASIPFDQCERLAPLSAEERYFLSLRRFVDQLMAAMGVAADRAEAAG